MNGRQAVHHRYDSLKDSEAFSPQIRSILSSAHNSGRAFPS